MDLIDNLVSFLNKPEPQTTGQTPEGLCPLCWGHQQYDQQIRELFKDKQIDVTNHQAKYTLIQDFVVNKISGIRLKKHEGHIHECPDCGSSIQKERPNQ